MITKLIIISAIAMLAIMEIAAIIVNRLKISRALASGEETYNSTELNWLKSTKHTIVMYGAPVLILVMPFLAGWTPTLNDIFQSATVYLVLSYLKSLYWH